MWGYYNLGGSVWQWSRNDSGNELSSYKYFAIITVLTPKTKLHKLILTKMPPNLSNIQCLGAFKRFKCFLGPRAWKKNQNWSRQFSFHRKPRAFESVWTSKWWTTFTSLIEILFVLLFLTATIHFVNNKHEVCAQQQFTIWHAHYLKFFPRSHRGPEGEINTSGWKTEICFNKYSAITAICHF